MQENTINKLRIMVILPFYGGSLPIGRYCASALKNLGHHVDVFESPGFNESFNAIQKLQLGLQEQNYFEQNYLNLVSKMIYARAELFKPDLILCLAQAPMNIYTLKRLRQDGITTAMWFVEDYRLFTYWRAFAPYYDFFAIIQKEPFLSELANIGVENALYLPLAALPNFHKPYKASALENQQFGADLSFLGAGYPNRRVAFRRLLPFNLKIWGTEWGGDAILEPFVQMNGARISSEDAVKIYNASKINLNLHSSVQTKTLVTGEDFVNPRTFELAACGAFQLVDKRSLMPELFAEDELATFDSLDTLIEKIRYFLDNPAERQIYIEKSRQRVLAEHSYEQRMSKLIDFIAERKPEWINSRQQEASTLDQLKALGADSLPYALKNDLLQLFETLQLPADIAFADLIVELRKQNGCLNALESSLLFLDEWCKQYDIKKVVK